MQYNLKEKIKVTEEFLRELISESWHETDAIQQQIANIDTTTDLGSEVTRLLNSLCTSYYILVGCLEALVENSEKATVDTTRPTRVLNNPEPTVSNEELTIESEVMSGTSAEHISDFEPFEYFVDFDEPYGEPITDDDLYSK